MPLGRRRMPTAPARRCRRRARGSARRVRHCGGRAASTVPRCGMCWMCRRPPNGAARRPPSPPSGLRQRHAAPQRSDGRFGAQRQCPRQGVGCRPRRGRLRHGGRGAGGQGGQPSCGCGRQCPQRRRPCRRSLRGRRKWRRRRRSSRGWSFQPRRRQCPPSPPSPPAPAFPPPDVVAQRQARRRRWCWRSRRRAPCQRQRQTGAVGGVVHSAALLQTPRCLRPRSVGWGRCSRWPGRRPGQAAFRGGCRAIQCGRWRTPSCQCWAIQRGPIGGRGGRGAEARRRRR